MWRVVYTYSNIPHLMAPNGDVERLKGLEADELRRAMVVIKNRRLDDEVYG